ncbi:hypothetical protein [Streptomyces adelaidensis]|nr:hypothetical protein [Streptomyces adelaidensis]
MRPEPSPPQLVGGRRVVVAREQRNVVRGRVLLWRRVLLLRRWRWRLWRR